MTSRIRGNRVRRSIIHKLREHQRDFLKDVGEFKGKTPNLEAEFDRIVLSAGGKRISTLVGNGPRLEKNPDYIFEDAACLIELKSFQADYETPEVVRRFVKLAKEVGDDPHRVLRTFLAGEPLPDKSSKLFVKRFRRYIEKIIRRGNAQLQTFRNSAERPYSSIIVLINDAIRIIDPYTMLMFVEAESLRFFQRSLDGVVFCSGNVPILVPKEPGLYSYWQPIYKNKVTNDALSPLLDELGIKWLQHQGSVCDIKRPSLALNGREEMEHFLSMGRPYWPKF